MRAIGEVILEKGFDVEYHTCPSDNYSIDGIVIPALKIALIDGTASHDCEFVNTKMFVFLFCKCQKSPPIKDEDLMLL